MELDILHNERWYHEVPKGIFVTTEAFSTKEWKKWVAENSMAGSKHVSCEQFIEEAVRGLKNNFKIAETSENMCDREDLSLLIDGQAGLGEHLTNLLKNTLEDLSWQKITQGE